MVGVVAATELNYFMFENHIRRQMQDLLEPTVIKQLADREVVLEMKSQLKGISKWVDELEYIVFKSKEKNSIFDNIFDKISKLVRASRAPSVTKWTV